MQPIHKDVLASRTRGGESLLFYRVCGKRTKKAKNHVKPGFNNRSIFEIEKDVLKIKKIYCHFFVGNTNKIEYNLNEFY